MEAGPKEKKKKEDISMPVCIDKAIHNFQYSSPICKQNIPHQWRIPKYGARIKYAPGYEITFEIVKDEEQKSRLLLEHSCTILGL